MLYVSVIVVNMLVSPVPTNTVLEGREKRTNTFVSTWPAQVKPPLFLMEISSATIVELSWLKMSV